MEDENESALELQWTLRRATTKGASCDQRVLWHLRWLERDANAGIFLLLDVWNVEEVMDECKSWNLNPPLYPTIRHDGQPVIAHGSTLHTPGQRIRWPSSLQGALRTLCRHFGATECRSEHGECGRHALRTRHATDTESDFELLGVRSPAFFACCLRVLPFNDTTLYSPSPLLIPNVSGLCCSFGWGVYVSASWMPPCARRQDLRVIRRRHDDTRSRSCFVSHHSGDQSKQLSADRRFSPPACVRSSISRPARCVSAQR
jgi:hypothetical protein